MRKQNVGRILYEVEKMFSLEYEILKEKGLSIFL